MKQGILVRLGARYIGFYLLAIIFSAFTSCRSSEKIVESENSFTSIEFTKGGCLDNCMSYSIVISSTGSYTYTGRYNVNKKGESSGTLSQQNLSQLSAMIKEIPWDTFRDEYGTQAEDSQRKELTYISADTQKKVVYFRMEPQEIKDLETYFDNLIQSDEFK